MAKQFIPWSGVTDPEHHDPDHFRYLLHLDGGRPSDPDDEYSVPQFFLDYPEAIPQSLVNAGHLSASLVDQDHPLLYEFTAAFHGFVIEVPPEGVIATCPTDMGIAPKTSPPMDPDQLMAETSPHDWNEVEVSTEIIVVRAIFWVIDNDIVRSDRKLEEQFDLETVRQASVVAGLPFIEIDLIKY